MAAAPCEGPGVGGRVGRPRAVCEGHGVTSGRGFRFGSQHEGRSQEVSSRMNSLDVLFKGPLWCPVGEKPWGGGGGRRSSRISE